jgi:hypothetical protein
MWIQSNHDTKSAALWSWQTGSVMQRLNPQTIHAVLSFLDRKDLCASSNVSRDFYRLVNGPEGDSVWHELFRYVGISILVSVLGREWDAVFPPLWLGAIGSRTW